ncbi:TIM barrel protein [Maribacter algarum]|uniref:TIM barrel protein n=1 Tax=Maribacter algarum (ex Zhang et al. 2020) TaxID=2578118 RepID=A0A5S3PUU9_9FLAO|nr:sugar phosphate isomerase/epimerase family protein [Maribacter algarum]TMM56718.1 TIM barrel protein [Maribacter algarum]
MKNDKEGISRRNFTKLSAAALGSIPLMGFDNSLLDSLPGNKDDIQVNLFSKHLQFLDYNNMSEAAAEIGFDGLDLTVRPKGHVLPERSIEDLPKAVEAMKKFGLQTTMMTTNIIDSNDPQSKEVLETASALGLTHYRTGWLTYPEKITIPESIEVHAQKLAALETLNKKLGLYGGYQNHFGNHVGAPIWDIPEILKKTSSLHMGCQYDIRHAIAEGGGSWQLGLRLVQSYINSIDIKDFKWGQKDGKWQPINVPLGEGIVDFDSYFKLLKKYEINVPMSLHLEYDLGGAEHGDSKITIDKKEVFAQMKKDLTFLRKAWQQAE